MALVVERLPGDVASDRLRWAPKLAQHRIRRLYEDDARGIIDPELVEDVGWRLWARSESILLVSRGQVRCPRCQSVFTVASFAGGTPVPSDEAGFVSCPTLQCGWRTTADSYHQSWRHQDLIGCKAIGEFQEFFERFPVAASAAERLLLVDRLIHSFHWDLKLGLPNRSVGNNLIEGSHDQVVEFLDRLTAGAPSLVEDSLSLPPSSPTDAPDDLLDGRSESSESGSASNHQRERQAGQPGEAPSVRLTDRHSDWQAIVSQMRRRRSGG